MADIVLGSLSKIIHIGFKIKDAMDTVKQNNKECQDIEICVAHITDVMSPMVKRFGEVSPVIEVINQNDQFVKSMRNALEYLAKKLAGALELVTKCQQKHDVGSLIRARAVAKQLRRVHDEISRALDMISFTINMAQFGSTWDNNVQKHKIRSEMDEAMLATRNRAPSDPLSGGLIYFGLSELEMATHNFSEENLIGYGGDVKIFKGELPNGLVVAVKEFYGIDWGSGRNENLYNEIMIGGMLQHKNVVKTLGYCVTEKVVMVWHDGREVQAINPRGFLVRGYLSSRNLSSVTTGAPRIYWPFYIAIIKGIAQGLDYLHDQDIVHLDLKPDNITFDPDMNPVIVDFSLSRVLDDFTIPTNEYVGTLGYMPPEYIDSGTVSKKYDVFSFGVIILRTIFQACAKVEFQNHNLYYDQNSELEGVGKIKELFDPTLVEESELMDVARCIKVAKLCTEFDPAHRPTMAEVLKMLNREKQLPAQENKRSKNSSSSEEE